MLTPPSTLSNDNRTQLPHTAAFYNGHFKPLRIALSFLSTHRDVQFLSYPRNVQIRYTAFLKHGTGYAVECLNV